MSTDWVGELERVFRENLTGGASVSIWQHGKELLTVHAGWPADSLVPVFSATKPASALCLLLALHDCCRTPELEVGDIWPAFPAPRCTVGQVLSHQCGLAALVEPAYLEQFALMGSIYMKKMFSLESPRVALLNNGTESCKGTPVQVEAYQRLSQLKCINFVGNVEANRFAFNTCDVLVTDGFTGNILLKGIEGLGKLLFGSIKETLRGGALTMLGAALIKKPMRAMKKSMDPNEYGGAPLLGIAHPVIKAHGSSNAKAFKNAIRQAIQYAESGMIEEIAKEAAYFTEQRKQEREAARASKEDSPISE